MVVSGVESLIVYYLVVNDIASFGVLLSHLTGNLKRGVPLVPTKRRFSHVVGTRTSTIEVKPPGEEAEEKEATAAHDGVVTDKELKNIHTIDKFCTVVFPIAYLVACDFVFRSAQ